MEGYNRYNAQTGTYQRVIDVIADEPSGDSEYGHAARRDEPHSAYRDEPRHIDTPHSNETYHPQHREERRSGGLLSGLFGGNGGGILSGLFGGNGNGGLFGGGNGNGGLFGGGGNGILGGISRLLPGLGGGDGGILKNLGLGGGDGGILKNLGLGLKLGELETEDFIVMLILYLMYRESGDFELLIAIGAMLFL